MHLINFVHDNCMKYKVLMTDMEAKKKEYFLRVELLNAY